MSYSQACSYLLPTGSFRIGLLVLLWIVRSIHAEAQDPAEMLIGNIAGNSYEIRTTDSDEKETARYLVIAGALSNRAGRLELPIDIYSYDEKGRQQDSSRTVYTCSPEQKQLVMVLFSLATKQKKSSIRITDVNSPDLYPEVWNGTMKLPDRTVEMDLEGGVAGFFGAHSKVVYANRLLEPIDPTGYSITGKLTISTSVWGVNVSTIRFRITEKIDTTIGVVRQDLYGSTGAHTTVELQPNRPAH